MIKLAVDIDGSDLGEEELLNGAKNYLKDNKDVYLVFYGRKVDTSFLSEYSDRFEFVETKDVVPMEVSPLQFLRLKESSMVKGLKDTMDKNYDGFITCGSSGGFITGATLICKRIKGVERAAFCAPFVTAVKGKQTVILDIGASNENTSDDLVTFAKLGSLYSKHVLNVDNPSVYLLSNGAEEGKGLPVIVEAYSKLKDNPNFKGNCEAREALDGSHDVIVTPGFEGNIFLKAVEGVASMMNAMIKKAFKKNVSTKIGYLFARSGFKDMKETMDYKKTGGAILLGVNKVCVKSHGNSDKKAFYYALDVAYKMAKNNIVEKISEEFNSSEN